MNKKGFTLIELLAVIAILAILVIVVTPNVLNMFNESKAKTNVVEVKSIANTAEQYYVANKKNKSVNGSFNGKTNLIKKIPLTGRQPNGKITITSKGIVTAKLIIDGYEYTYVTGEEDVDIRKLSEEELVTSTKSSPFEFLVDENVGKNVGDVRMFKVGGDTDFFTMDDLAGGYYTLAYQASYDGETEKVVYTAALTEDTVDVSLEECYDGRHIEENISIGYSSIFNNEEMSVGNGANNFRVISFELGYLYILEDMDAVNFLNEEAGEEVVTSPGTYYILPFGMPEDDMEIKYKVYWSYDEQYDINSDPDFDTKSCS